MLLLGAKNTATQAVDVDGLINLGQVYRRYCKKNKNSSAGIPWCSFLGMEQPSGCR